MKNYLVMIDRKMVRLVMMLNHISKPQQKLLSIRFFFSVSIIIFSIDQWTRGSFKKYMKIFVEISLYILMLNCLSRFSASRSSLFHLSFYFSLFSVAHGTVILVITLWYWLSLFTSISLQRYKYKVPFLILSYLYADLQWERG